MANDAGRVPLEPHEPILWEVHGLRRRTVVCRPDEIRLRERVCVVGFFAERRDDIDYVSLEELEMSLLLEFRQYPGILSYSSIELVDGYWANLVVHSDPIDRQEWRRSEVHAHAAERIAPQIYTDVRIHNGYLDGGAIGTETVVIESTKYWDYEVTPTWHAIRTLPGGAAETVDQPVES